MKRIKPTTLNPAGQPAQHTTKELFRPPSSRTAGLTHYQGAILAPTAGPTHYQGAIAAPIKQDSQPNTLPRSYSGPDSGNQTQACRFRGGRLTTRPSRSFTRLNQRLASALKGCLSTTALPFDFVCSTCLLSYL